MNLKTKWFSLLMFLLICWGFVSPPAAAQNIDQGFYSATEQVNDQGIYSATEQVNDQGIYYAAPIEGIEITTSQDFSIKSDELATNIIPDAVSNSRIKVSPIKNVPDTPVLTIGVSELRDAAALFFSGYEAYIKASSDGSVNMSDLQYLIPVAMAIVPAFSGATQIPSELKALTDDQIKTLLLVADDYQLGAHAQRAKQVFKTLLTLAQTYFVFEASGSQ